MAKRVPRKGLRKRKAVRRVAKKKRFISGCYIVGKARIRRRKMNRRRVPQRSSDQRAAAHKGYDPYNSPRHFTILTAQKPGGPRLRYVGNSKFSAKGRPVYFKDESQARAAAWIMRDTFPETLRGYELTPHPDI